MLGSLDRQRLFAFLFQKSWKPAEICGFRGMSTGRSPPTRSPNRSQPPRIGAENRGNRRAQALRKRATRPESLESEDRRSGFGADACDSRFFLGFFEARSPRPSDQTAWI